MFWVSSWQVKEGWGSTPEGWGARTTGTEALEWDPGSHTGSWAHSFSFQEQTGPRTKKKLLHSGTNQAMGFNTTLRSLDLLPTFRSYCRFIHRWDRLKAASEKVIKQEDRMKHGKVKPMPVREKSWNRDVLKWPATSKRMSKWYKSWAKKKKPKKTRKQSLVN